MVFHEPVWLSVHPHVRGANVLLEEPGEEVVRFIPTCVGLIPGETYAFGPGNGSSPRAWGKLLHQLHVLRGERFIPTCVGQILALLGHKRTDIRFIPTCVGDLRSKHYLNSSMPRP